VELLEIERELRGADKESALAKYDAVLLGLEARLKEAQRRGMSPDEYAKCEPLGEAIVVARKLMRLQMRGEGR